MGREKEQKIWSSNGARDGLYYEIRSNDCDHLICATTSECADRIVSILNALDAEIYELRQRIKQDD